MKKIAVLFLAIILINGCGTKNPEQTFDEDKTFPKVKNLRNFPESTFLATLESDFSTDKNGIYAASLLFAWNEIREHFKGDIKDIKGEKLEELHNSMSFKDVLKEGEYSTEIEVEAMRIVAKAFFKKSLPFSRPFYRSEKEFKFENKNVASFGFWGSHENAKIVYYNNDNDFALRLLPEDEAHEIILMKSNFEKNTNLGREVKRLEILTKEFKQKENEKNYWRYYLQAEDQTIIPIVAFHIEHDYEDIVGATHISADKVWEIAKTYQRTAFILNEKGAEVESEAELVEEPTEEEEDKPQPKKLFFDKPFLILLKRKDNPNPYFAMFVANAELLAKPDARSSFYFKTID